MSFPACFRRRLTPSHCVSSVTPDRVRRRHVRLATANMAGAPRKTMLKFDSQLIFDSTPKKTKSGMKTNQQFWQAFWISKFGCFNLHKLVCFRGDFGDKPISKNRGICLRIPPSKLTCPLKRDHFKRRCHFSTINFQGISRVYILPDALANDVWMYGGFSRRKMAMKVEVYSWKWWTGRSNICCLQFKSSSQNHGTVC